MKRIKKIMNNNINNTYYIDSNDISLKKMNSPIILKHSSTFKMYENVLE